MQWFNFVTDEDQVRASVQFRDRSGSVVYEQEGVGVLGKIKDEAEALSELFDLDFDIAVLDVI